MRKKLFAILMSAMMMVTFMPAMAFADASFTCTWNDLSSITVSNGTVSATVATTEEFCTLTGKVAVTASETSIASVIDGNTAYNDYATDMKAALNAETKYYIDLKGAELFYTASKKIPTTLSNLEFAGLKSGLGTYAVSYLKVYEPATLAGTSTPKSAVVNAFDGWAYAVKTTGFDATSTAAQAPVVTLDWSINSVVDGKTNAYLKNTGAEFAFVTRADAPKTAGETKFYLDGKTTSEVTTDVSGNATVSAKYDGAEHKIVACDMPGYSVVYKLFNTKTGAYDVVDAVSWKDATTAAKIFQVVVTNTDATKAKTDTATFNFAVSVAKADVYVALCNDRDGLVRYEGDKYDAFDFVEFTAYGTENKAALATDEAAIKDLVKTVYEATATPDKYEADKVALTFTEKTGLTQADRDAYAAAQKNWTLTVSTATGRFAKTLTIKPAYIDNEIDFIGNVKKIKAGKSKTIKAEALNGVAPTFKKLAGNSKIKVAANGKVTVKKGLKKGTYKVKVKATAAAAKGYKRVSATKVYKIKVVK